MQAKVKLFYSYVLSITIGIDRIEISIPEALHAHLVNRLEIDGSKPEIYDEDNYHIFRNKVLGRRIKVKRPIEYSLDCYQRRVYIEIFNPDTEFQEYIKTTLIDIANFKSRPLYSIVIKQLEVKYDFHCGSSEDRQHNDRTNKAKHFLVRHLVHKYSRSNSYTKKMNTNYFGRNADIRKGTCGSRIYAKENKHEPTTTFARLEFQNNGDYFQVKKIKITDLPLKPLPFESLNKVDFYDDFSEAGIKHIAKILLKKEGGYRLLDTKLFNKALYAKMDELKATILRNSNNTMKNVHQQMASISELKKRYEFPLNHKQYFTPLKEIKQLILCYADISYNEDLCSKRMVLCQS